jgi:hypothetical protein
VFSTQILGSVGIWWRWVHFEGFDGGGAEGGFTTGGGGDGDFAVGGGLGSGLGSFSRCVYDGGGELTRHHPIGLLVFPSLLWEVSIKRTLG